MFRQLLATIWAPGAFHDTSGEGSKTHTNTGRRLALGHIRGHGEQDARVFLMTTVSLYKTRTFRKLVEGDAWGPTCLEFANRCFEGCVETGAKSLKDTVGTADGKIDV